MALQQDIEAGIVKLDGKVLPGALQRLVIGHEIIIDEIEIQDKDGHLKQPAGYDEGTITIELAIPGADIDPDDAYAKLSEIQALFKRTEGQLKPEIHDIVNVHTTVRGIKQVLFRALQSEVSSENDVLIVQIDLEEYIPLAVQVVQQLAQSQASQKVQDAVSSTTGAPAAGGGAGTPGEDAGQ